MILVTSFFVVLKISSCVILVLTAGYLVMLGLKDRGGKDFENLTYISSSLSYIKKKKKSQTALFSFFLLNHLGM